jgi:hypothetical protein
VLVVGAASGQMLTSKVDLPKDSPVSVLTADFSKSSAAARGGVYVVEVRAALSLRNTSQKHIRGIALAAYQDVSAKLSFFTPSLNVAPGETFNLMLNNRLTRPTPGNGGASIEVKLDGVLFDDFNFYGSDQQAQYMLTKWEMEARRDRTYLKDVLAKSGPDALQKQMLALASQNERRSPNPGVQIVRRPATNQEPERDVQFAFTAIPDSPVVATGGMAKVSSREVRAPRFTFHNRGRRPVEHVEIGWIVKDQQGREFYAATMPADLKLAPNQSGEVRQENTLRFERPVAVEKVTGFVAGVEFADGTQWVPPRNAFAGGLERLVPLSTEEARLLEIYSRRGVEALVEELKKF